MMANSQRDPLAMHNMLVGNLRYLRIEGCNRLKNIFSLSIARGLVQLQGLYISHCDALEEIFSKEGEDEKEVDMIKFLKSTHITLEVFPRLIGFYKPMDPVELVQPSHAKSTQPSSNQEVSIPLSLSLPCFITFQVLVWI